MNKRLIQNNIELINYNCIFESRESVDSMQSIYRLSYPYYTTVDSQIKPLDIFMLPKSQENFPFFLKGRNFPLLSNSINSQMISVKNDFNNYQVTYHNLPKIEVSSFLGISIYNDFVIIPFSEEIDKKDIKSIVYFFGDHSNSCNEAKLSTVINYLDLKDFYNKNSLQLGLFNSLKYITFAIITFFISKMIFNDLSIFKVSYLKIRFKKNKHFSKFLLILFLPQIIFIFL